MPHPGIAAIEDHSMHRLRFKCVCVPGLQLPPLPRCWSQFFWTSDFAGLYSPSKKHLSRNCTIKYSMSGLWCWSSCCLCCWRRQATNGVQPVCGTHTYGFLSQTAKECQWVNGQEEITRMKRRGPGKEPCGSQTQIHVCLSGSFWRCVPESFYDRMPRSHNLGLGFESLAFIYHLLYSQGLILFH